MRVALVSPYSWTVPGGVNQHVASLAASLRSAGHEACVLAPATDAPATATDTFIPLGGTVALPFNGATSNVAMSPLAGRAVRREIRAGDFDVVHVHEPYAAMVGRQAVAGARGAVVGTFHSYSEERLPHTLATAVGTRPLLNRLHARIAVSNAAEWTARRFYGGRYRIIPNGIHLDRVPRAGDRLDGSRPLHVAFVGQAVERKGLGVLLQAVALMRRRRPVRLTVVGADPGAVADLLSGDGVSALGRVTDAERDEVVRTADLLCAPSLGGESFGLVLAEAFAVGTPVVASDIPGYRDVVQTGVSGVLVPPRDVEALARTLTELDRDRPRLAALADGAVNAAPRYAWPRVADEVLEVYEDAMRVPAPARPLQRAAVRVGIVPADGRPEVRATPLPSLAGSSEPPVPLGRIGRRAAGAAALAAIAWAAIARVDWHGVGGAVVAASPTWTIFALGLMAVSVLLRAGAWRSILGAASVRPSLTLAFRATAIGVLMSATAPARIGEAARTLVVSRRLKSPVALVAGSILAQTVLNAVALALLAVVVLRTIGLPGAGSVTLLAYAAAPAVICAGVVLVGRARAPSSSPLARALRRPMAVLAGTPAGMAVFRRPTSCGIATSLQLTAWAAQWLACVAVLHALHVSAGGRELLAGAALLLAVNVSAILPLTPSNVGVFQAACATVLTDSFHVGAADAVGIGLVLQAIEVATAVAVGLPALVGEGWTWRQARSRAIALTPARGLPASLDGAPA